MGRFPARVRKGIILTFLLIIPFTDLISAPFYKIHSADTTTTKDSIAKDTGSVSFLDSKVDYSAEDSMRFDLAEEKVYLFGKASVEYKKITLNAERIEFSFRDNTVFAEGKKDSTGELVGKPVFKEGNREFEAKTIRYNFKTKKGVITEVHTQEGKGDLYSAKTKKHPNDEIHVKGGKYTTCTLDDYYIRFNKAVVIPNDKIVSGPANLVVAGIPTPLVLPFGYYPNQKGGNSGIVLPQYGESPNLGFYLQDAGYYWRINPNIDTRITGDIYSKGSWGAKNLTRYKKRYKYNGQFNLSYANIKEGQPEFPNYQEKKEFFVKWRHQQDPKARPNSRFSANVNLGTSDHFRNNLNTSSRDYLTNTFQSNVRYSKNWNTRPYSLNAQLRHSQNTRTGNFRMTLPDIGFNVNRFYPLAYFRDEKVGGKKWYEKIGMNYVTNFKNQLETTQDELALDRFRTLADDNTRYGMNHNLRLTSSFKPGQFTVTPAFSLRDRWYLETYRKYWDLDSMETRIDTSYGFKSAMDYSLRTDITTKLYGMYQFKRSRLKAIRHVITPNIGVSYQPAFDGDLIREDINNDGIKEEYSPYENTLFGGPSTRESGRVNISLINNVEGKLRAKNDSVDKEKKIKLIDNFTVNSFYDIFRDSMNWSTVNFSGRTTLFDHLNLRLTGVVDPYSYSEQGTRIDESLLSDRGRLARITRADMTIGGHFQSKRSDDGSNAGSTNEDVMRFIRNNPQAYVDFSVPWNFNFNYTLRVDNRFVNGRDTLIMNQSLDVNGGLRITDNWKVDVRTGYDFEREELSYTRINIYRDLGCWEMSFRWIPFGQRRSYSFQINLKSPLLKDLKLQKRRSWYDRDLELE